MLKYLLILLILTSTHALAEISKWVDADGKVHYSDQPPPPEAKSKTLKSFADTHDSASSSVAAPKTVAEREA